MSRAFIKEDAAPDEDPPERPVSSHPNYMTPRGVRLLRERETALDAQWAGLSGAQEDPERRRRKRVLERDLRYVRARLESALPVDPAAAPKGEVRFGARAVLRRAGGADFTVRIVGEDEAEEGGEFVSWTSPLAQALLGLKPGQSFDVPGAETGLVVSVAYESSDAG